MAFSPRLSSAGMTSLKYYSCNYGDHRFTYQLPVCTSYAMGRIHEIAIHDYGYSWSDITYQNDPTWWRTSPTFGHAYQWYSQAQTAGPAHGWTLSSTPQIGAIACWDNRTDEGGHVAVVENVESNGYCTFSMSEYGGQYFRTRRMRPRVGSTGYGYGAFLGYLINPLTAGDTPGPEIKPQPIIYRRGDWVKIVSFGNANSYGTGRKAYGIGWKRQILKVWTGRPYPYQVGLGRSTTGFYKAEALSKI